MYDVRLEWLNERKTRDCDFSLGTWPSPQLLCAHTHQTHMLPVFTQHVSTFATRTKKSFLSSVTNLKTSKPIFCSKWTVFGSYIRMSTHFNNFQSPYMSALNIKGRAVLSNEMKILEFARHALGFPGNHRITRNMRFP